MAYYDMVDLYKNPHHYGKLKEFDLHSEDSSSSCSDSFAVYIKTDAGHIADLSFDGSGCIISTVSMSKVCDFLVGKELSKVKYMGLEDVKKLIGIDKISMNRINCAMIGLETIKKAVSDAK